MPRNKTKAKDECQNSSQNTASIQNNNSNTYINNRDGNQLNTPSTADVMSQSREVLYGQNCTGINMQRQNDAQNMQSNVILGQEQCLPFQPNYHPGQHSVNLNQAQVNPGVFAGYGLQPNTMQSQDAVIPPWAVGLCNQIMAVQKTLDSQLNRWQTVESHIASQNKKMEKIETQISEMTDLREKCNSANTQLSEFRKEIKVVQTKVTEYDRTIQQYSDICDDISVNNNEIDKRLYKLEKQIQSLEDKHSSLEQKTDNTDERVTDIQWRCMRENLLFCGIPEATNYKDEGENCEQILQTFIKNNLGIEREIPLDRAHRLGRFKKDNARPRPIVAKFTYFKDKEHVKATSLEKLPDTDFWVKEHYPREIEDKRRPLYEIAKQFRSVPENKVRLVRDKLFVNGQLYKQGNTDNENPTRDFNKRYASATTASNDADRRYMRTTSQISNGSQWGRTFYRRNYNTPTHQVANTIKTFNKFATLAEQPTPRRQNLAGKKKATSPLENAENSSKKQHIEISDSENELDITLSQDVFSTPKTNVTDNCDNNENITIETDNIGDQLTHDIDAPLSNDHHSTEEEGKTD